MPYIGKSPLHGNYSKLDDFSGDFDGSDATHALAINSISLTPVTEAAVIISINGVLQEPVTDYTVSGTNITFTTAPASGANFFGVVLGEQLAGNTPSDSTITSAKLSGNLVTPGTLDVNGQELILDADADTSITADTDDQIDIRISGADDFTFTANTFTAARGSGIVIPDGGLTLGSTAVSSTATELNKLDALSRGSILYGNASAVTTVLTKGSADQVLTSDGTDIAWAAAGGGAVTQLNNATADELVTVGSTTTQLDAETDLTFDGARLNLKEADNEANMSIGICINQQAEDNKSFILKSSDIAHGMTSEPSMETDSYFGISKASATSGGIIIQVPAENDKNEGVVLWRLWTDPTLTATKTTGNWGGAFEINIYGHDGSNGLANHDANGNLFSISSQLGGGRHYVFGIDNDGDVYSDSGTAMTQFDDKDDAMLLRTFAIETADPAQTIRTGFDDWLKYNRDDLIEANIIGDDREPTYDEAGNRGVGLVNTTQLARLHTGAIVQQRAMFETMKQTVEEMLPGFGEKLNAKLVEQSLPALPAFSV